MPGGMAREKKHGSVGTEDALTLRLLQAASWASRHRRAALAVVFVLALVGLGIRY